jgi:hypothetical protein
MNKRKRIYSFYARKGDTLVKWHGNSNYRDREKDAKSFERNGFRVRRYSK